ncbi:hypothetical protein CDD83_3892 [Cordyceps sp. RAO-2017]|nr:hypothetical protein CDD83_3892 [Cordyceps sp. RAO-2017]
MAEWDVVGGALDAVLDGAQARGWDVALDKGTFDAVSLSGGRDGDGGRLCEGYAARVRDLVRPGGLFLLTSCNWTADELVRWFAAPPDPAFAVVGAVPYRSFDFGGVRGQAISTLCFRRL